jgi:hypothetical protein
MAYPRLHLLGLPVELRLTIWRHIHNDILASSGNQWHEPPVTSWGGLNATSRTIYNEISEFWLRTMVPYHKNDSFSRGYGRVTNLADGLTTSMFRDFRQLSIQLPIQQNNKPKQFFRQIAAGLLQLAPVLQDLRIFFIGEDGFGTSTNYMGCGLREYSDLPLSFTQKLRKEGSYYSERGFLFRILKNLYFLGNLVISNANYPLLQTLIGHKPALETLHLVTDSRSALYKHLGGPLVNWHPPNALKTLQISANAVLGAANMTLKVMDTLQDLTFLIPSTGWQEQKWDWLEDIAIIVRNIDLRGKEMRRFRLCVEQPLHEATVGNLLFEFKQHLPRTDLQILEIHATVYSEHFGRELIEALPKTLKRLYVSQEMVRAKDLVAAVKERYFGEKDRGGHQEAGNLGFVGYEYWERQSTKLALLRMNGALLDRERNAHLLDDPEDASFRFGGGSFPVKQGTLSPFTVEEIGEDVMSEEDVPEMALMHYEDQTVEHIMEMGMAFHAEEPAKAEDRIPFLVLPDVVEVGGNDHWMTD